MRTSRSTWLLCIAALLAGCVTPTSRELPPLSDWEVRQQVLGDISSWGFSGRIAVSDGNDGFNGNLNWEQRREYFDARLSGPLGAGSVRISGDTDTIKVTDSDGMVTELADAERALQRVYGWDIPVASLRYWALGIPDPAAPSEARFAADNSLSGLQQGGWQVSIDQYRESAGQIMPRRITAVSDATRVRLVVDRWTFH